MNYFINICDEKYMVLVCLCLFCVQRFACHPALLGLRRSMKTSIGSPDGTGLLIEYDACGFRVSRKALETSGGKTIPNTTGLK